MNKYLVKILMNCINVEQAKSISELFNKKNKNIKYYYDSNRKKDVFQCRYVCFANNENEAKEIVMKELKFVELERNNEQLKCIKKEIITQTIKHLDGYYVENVKNITHSSFNKKINKNKILIIGTRITSKSIDAGYYYLGVEDSNPFWKNVGHSFGIDELINLDYKTNAKQRIVCNLNANNIVVSDLIYSCDYLGSLDEETLSNEKNEIIEQIIPNPDLISLFEQSDLIILNGTSNTFELFKKMLGNYIEEQSDLVSNEYNERKADVRIKRGFVIINGQSHQYIALPSTSGTNTQLSREEKIKYWSNYSKLLKK